jgi:hypothetical protein
MTPGLSNTVALCSLLLSLWLAGTAACATQGVQRDYMLNCQGCHLDNGVGFPQRGVPRLTGYMGKFLHVPGGRAFLVQVPGSAQSSLSNERLAGLLNWMLASFSPSEVPGNFKPYSAAEVGALRLHPLVAVTAKRTALVQQIENNMPRNSALE